MEYKQLNIFDIAAEGIFNDKTISQESKAEAFNHQRRKSVDFDANNREFKAKTLHREKKQLEDMVDWNKVGVDGQMSMKFNSKGDFVGTMTDAIDTKKIAKSISNYKMPLAIGGAVLGGMAIQKIFSNDNKRN